MRAPGHSGRWPGGRSPQVPRPSTDREAETVAWEGRARVDGLDEIVGEFLVESHENLDQLDRDLVELERDPTRASCWRASSGRSTRSRAPAASSPSASWSRSPTSARTCSSRLRDGKMSLTPADHDGAARDGRRGPRPPRARSRRPAPRATQTTTPTWSPGSSRILDGRRGRPAEPRRAPPRPVAQPVAETGRRGRSSSPVAEPAAEPAARLRPAEPGDAASRRTVADSIDPRRRRRCSTAS